MRKLILIGMLLSLVLAGCGISKDAEFKTFMADFEKVTNDITAKVDADPTETGVGEAQKILDGKKADLKSKWAAIKDARGIQISQDTQKGFEEGMKRSSDKVTGVLAKIQEPEAMEKYQKLIKDWGDIVGAGAAQ